MRRVVSLYNEGLICINVVNKKSKYRVWTSIEIEKLREMYYTDYSIKDIAKELERTQEAIKSKVKEIGLFEDYYRDVIFPTSNQEWKYFIKVIWKHDNCKSLLQALGQGYTRLTLLKALDVAVREGVISVGEFNNIVITFNLHRTTAYTVFKRGTRLNMHDII